MSVKLGEITNLVENLAPLGYAYKWDNVGLQIGSKGHSVHRILTTLEVTEAVLDEAIEKDIDMIITHHPMIFSPIKSIIRDDMKGKLIFKAIENNISIYAVHTNIDAAPNGLNEHITNMLNIKSEEVVEKAEYEDDAYAKENAINGIGRIGRLDKSKTLEQLVEHIKEKMDISYVRVVGDLLAAIDKIAVINGSGADLIGECIKKGCDCVITGDVKYHDAQDALSQGISIIDIGHYDSEKYFSAFLAEYLIVKINKSKLDVEVLASTIDINPFKTL